MKFDLWPNIVSCNKCNNTGMIQKMGGMQEKCSFWFCRWQIKNFVKSAPKKFITFIVNNPIKKYPVSSSFLAAIVILMLARHYQVKITLEAIIADFGLIYIALKYKLDQADYNKELFEDRYIIFRYVDEVIWEWAQSNKATEAMISKLSDNTMRKAYCLFDRDTYFFIKKVRQSIINLRYQATENEQIQAREFLISLIDNENLPEKFQSLKISEY